MNRCLAPSPRILLQDSHLVALHKPSGWFTHPTALDRNAPDATTWLKGQGLRAQAAHRLDRGASGLLLFGLTASAANDLMRQFREGEVKKTYQAWVRGWVNHPGWVDGPLETERGLQQAYTRFAPLAWAEPPWPLGQHTTARFSLLQLMPSTGRQHQLRRHLARIGHPILGDSSHGDARVNRTFAQHLGCQRLELCATQLTCFHPATGLPVALSTAPDLACLPDAALPPV